MSKLRRPRIAASLFVLAILSAAPALAQDARPVAVEAGPMEGALLSLARQTGHQLLFTSGTVAGLRAPAVRGELTPEAALQRLLAGTGLSAVRTGPRTLVIRRADAPEPARPFGAAAALPAPEPVRVEELLVTGTSLRGAGQSPAPLLTLDRSDLERTGQATIAAALQALPQTFGGESTETTVLTRGDRTGANAGLGTGVNLRGLGSDATLVLVNGRRMAGSGLRGDFTDLSSLPTAAVERVEVLLDGASAIYGSDAVGGVVNVILRRRLDGGEARVRGGAGSGGEPTEAVASLTLGEAWADGSLLFAYEAYRRSALAAADRDFARSADFRFRGGADRRDTFSFPGNVARIDPATLQPIPAWGVPPGQPGTALSPSDFQAGVLNLADPQAGSDLLPEQRRHAAYLAVRQAVGPRLEVSADARLGVRRAEARSFANTALISVTPANPFFVAPAGGTSVFLQYGFHGELPNPLFSAQVTSLAGSLGADLDLGRRWRLAGYAAHAQERTASRTDGLLNTTLLNEALGASPDSLLSAYSPALHGHFNPFTGIPGRNSAAALAAIGSGYTASRYRSAVDTVSATADGPLVSGPAGDWRLALGVQGRRETFGRSGVSFVSAYSPAPLSRLRTAREVAAAFAEVRAPLAGPEMGIPALHRLELSAAVRADRYSDFGTTTNPKLGLLWWPAEGLAFRATYGESFRAPSLQELRELQVYSPVRFGVGADRVLGLALQGGNPDLRPETAESWTAGVELAPPQLVGLRLSVGGFQTRFSHRIDRPLAGNRTTALTDPRFSPFVRRISPATNPDDLALIKALLADPSTLTSQGVFPPESYGAIVDQRFVNTGRVEVRGVDVQASFARDLAGGRLALALNATRILDYEQALTPTSAADELVGLVGYPARLRARLAADWSRGPVSAGFAVNHATGARDTLGARVDGHTTVDLQARLAGEAGTRWAGLALSLSVRNLLDADPPFYDNPTGLGFDPATADVVGRFVSLQLTRSW